MKPIKRIGYFFTNPKRIFGKHVWWLFLDHALDKHYPFAVCRYRE